MKITSSKNDSLHAAFRAWSESTIDVWQQEGLGEGPWKVWANMGTQNTENALAFAQMIQAAACLNDALNENEVEVDYLAPAATKEEYERDARKIERFLGMAIQDGDPMSDGSWLMAILQTLGLDF